jgi:hypothetical protein
MKNGHAYKCYTSWVNLNPSEVTEKLPINIVIELDQVSPIISSNGYNKKIASLPFKKTSKGFHYEFKGREFFQLDDGIVSRFRVKLKNEKDELLNLQEGQPTIIVLSLRKKNMASFPIIISSTDSRELFPNNNNATFKTKLPHPISCNGKWEVAISSVHMVGYLDKSHNFLGFESQLAIKTSDEEDVRIAPIIKKPIHVEEDIISMLTETLEQMNHNNCGNFLISNGELKFKANKDLTLGFVGNCARRLCNSDELRIYNIPRNETLTITKLDLKALSPQVCMIYTNITNPIVVGDNMLKLSKVIPMNHENLSNQYYESTQLNYVDLDETNFQTIDISLRDISGNEILFNDQVTITFLFRQFQSK